MDYWHEKNKELFDSFIRDLERNYPSLFVQIKNKLIYVSGVLKIKDDKNVVLGSYLINIEIPHNFPKEIPKVRETSNKIPRIADRHFEEDGSACLCFRDSIFIFWSKESTILDFMKIFVEPFFLWQIEFEASGGANKDRSFRHGIAGAIQFYGEILKTEDKRIIYRFVDLMTKKKIRGSWNCYCGSGKKIKDCHFDTIMRYKEKIRRKDARVTMNSFKIINFIR